MQYEKGAVKCMNKRKTAILLAAGSGKRMNSAVAKQFMLLDGKPLICHALQTIEASEVIDDCVVVTGGSDVDYVKTEIVEKYAFHKVKAVIAGGSERWESVALAVRAIAGGALEIPNTDGFLFIHDGARPFLTCEILEDTLRDVQKYHACVAAVPSKDTVKLSDGEAFAASTPDRRRVWLIQTPQVFDTGLVTKAYEKLMQEAGQSGKMSITVTDDASVVERYTDCRVKLTMASYTNMKITTPEDLPIAELLLRNGNHA